MNAEEAFSIFMSGMTPHLQEHVGAHVQGDLEVAKRMALHMEMYRGLLNRRKGISRNSRVDKRGINTKETSTLFRLKHKLRGPAR